MAATSLQDFIKLLPEINSKRRYWFFRTEGGEFYDDFIKGRYIAIGYNKISYADINAGNTGNATGIKILADKITKAYKEEEKRPSHSASQLLKFAYQIKKGDIVFIPSKNSQTITFGEVSATESYQKTEPDNCPYIKRKKVKWIKSLRRDDLDAKLFKLMFSHHTITEADAYARYIDKIINSFFLKDNKANLVLRVNTQDDIKAKHLFNMGVLALELADEFCEVENLSVNTDDVNVKLDVESPGDIVLAGYTIAAVVIVGLIFVGLAGGGFSFKNKTSAVDGSASETDVKMETPGLIEKMRSFLNSKSRRKDAEITRQAKKELLEQYLKEMQIEDPKELIKMINDLEK